jgi:myo-inositol-1(or 4)-monophosphatase
VSEADSLLEIAVAAARAAGDLLLERVRRGGERQLASKSSPTDPVSEADLASERAIRALLRERRPEDAFIGEEGGSEEGSSGLRWIVDPLDGTVNFLYGIPQWSVSVSVADDAGTIAGAIHDPNRNELFTATRDGRARLFAPSGVIELGGRARAPENADDEDDVSAALVATGLSYEAQVRAAQERVLARVASRVRDLRRFGSAALDLAWTAAGRYDAYFERTVKQWDIAAGVLICERAGLTVLELPVHDDLPWGILATRPSLAEGMLVLLGGPG